MDKRISYVVLPFFLVQQIMLPYFVFREEESKNQLSEIIEHSFEQGATSTNQETTLVIKKANRRKDRIKESDVAKKSFAMIEQEIANLESPLPTVDGKSTTEFGYRLKKMSGIMLCGIKTTI